MSAEQFATELYDRVFMWTGLPEAITGDSDTRLRGAFFTGVCKTLQVRLSLSVPYHPQTDGQTEVFNRTLLTMLRCTVNAYHSDWTTLLPVLLYSYNNTVHSATGYTPHVLLFGWHPRDLREPRIAASTIHPSDGAAFVHQRQRMFARARSKLENARARMIAQRAASASSDQYAVGDLVKVSTKVLPLRVTSTQVPKLLPRWQGPFRVDAVSGKGAYRLQLPDAYSSTLPTFNQHDIRPWLLPDEEPDSTIQPTGHVSRPDHVTRILDRRRTTRSAKRDPYSIRAAYLVQRSSGITEWVPQARLNSREDKALIRTFELQFPRSQHLPCESVAAYPAQFSSP